MGTSITPCRQIVFEKGNEDSERELGDKAVTRPLEPIKATAGKDAYPDRDASWVISRMYL